MSGCLQSVADLEAAFIDGLEALPGVEVILALRFIALRDRGQGLATLSGVTPTDVEAMAPTARTNLAAALRRAADVLHPPGDAVAIARCPEHGLHGERTTCFDCGGPVEQVRMLPLELEPLSPQ